MSGGYNKNFSGGGGGGGGGQGRKNFVGGGGGGGGCYKCGQTGHIARVCSNGAIAGGSNNPSQVPESNPARVEMTGPKKDARDKTDSDAIQSIDAAAKKRMEQESLKNLSANTLNIKTDAYGYRRTFTDLKDKDAFEVETNHFKLIQVPKLWVYKVNMFRVAVPLGTSIGAVKVKKVADKLLVLNAAAQRLAPFSDAPDRWATDGDLIWCIEQLPQVNHVQQPFQTLRRGPLWYQNELAKPLELQALDITFQQSIDANAVPMAELYHAGSATQWKNSVPGVLLRGFNAFMTKYARTQTQSLVFGSAGRSYNNNTANNPQYRLDSMVRAMPGFSLSVRPGVSQLLLNINTATSPFFRKVTVCDFINHQMDTARATATSVNAMLKGVKVRLLYDFDHPTVTQQDKDRFLQDKQVPMQTYDERKLRFICDFADDKFLQDRPNAAPPGTGQVIGDRDEQRAPRPNTTVWDWWNARHTSSQELGELHPNNRTPCDREAWAINVGKSTIRDSANGIWLPSDMLEIVDFQFLKGQLSKDQTERMVAIAILGPNNSRNAILSQGLPQYGLNTPGQQNLGSNNIATETTMARVPAYRLIAPKLVYFNNNQKTVNELGARWDLIKAKFINPCNIATLPYLTIDVDPTAPFPGNLANVLGNHCRVVANVSTPLVNGTTLAWNRDPASDNALLQLLRTPNAVTSIRVHAP